MRHSLSHILASAVLDMFPEAKLGMGPAIENGFYYDFELPRTLIPEDLPLLEEKMRKIIKDDLKFEKTEVPIDEALEAAKKNSQIYKEELIGELKSQEEKSVSFYKIDNFADLCKGPHVESTAKVGAFKLHKISGAYWKGDEKRPMLQRIYGLAFETQKELDDYLALAEEAKKRDHRKLGQELDLFTFSELVGPGLPLFTPKGTVILDELQKHIEAVSREYGFQKVSTPHLAKEDLYEKSGHKQKFGEELLVVNSHHKQNYYLKPVQCPHQIQIYASKPRSYRDLPIRYMESNKQYRDEKPGEIGGLKRVIAITVEDGHTFCTKEQVKDEIISLVNLIKDFYTGLGLWDSFWVSLSVRDYKDQGKYIGEPKDWDECEKILQEVSDELKLNAKKMEGEAALYGPKLDFMFKDTLGNEIQIPTVQIDFATPKRFNITYVDKNGKEVHPVMVHRAVLGSYERFLVMIIEHFAGAFPLWLSPIQAVVLPISDEKHSDYANEVVAKLTKKGIRAEIDARSESLGKRIRENEMQKVPYILVVGDKEKETGSVAVRERGNEKQEVLKTDKFAEKILREIERKK